MIIRNLAEHWQIKDTAVILGNFDGVHKGHQLLIDRAKEIAAEKGLQTAVLTFLPHPARLLLGEDFRLIYTEEEKEAIFAASGLANYIVLPFTEKNKNMAPREFIAEILLRRLGAKAVIAGSDYRFGQKAAGDAELLKAALAPLRVRVDILEKLQMQGEDVSSTRLRAAVARGDLPQFEALTGRSFHLLGRVSTGQQLGRTLGFPTINVIPPADKLLPPNGVYAAEVCYQGKCYQAISNVGVSPSIAGKPYAVETHIFDFTETIYGRPVEIRLLHYLRPEIAFASVEELKAQIQKDVAAVRAEK